MAEKEGRVAWNAKWVGLGMEGTGCALVAGAGGPDGLGWPSGLVGEGPVLEELIHR